MVSPVLLLFNVIYGQPFVLFSLLSACTADPILFRKWSVFSLIREIDFCYCNGKYNQQRPGKVLTIIFYVTNDFGSIRLNSTLKLIKNDKNTQNVIKT